MSKEKYVSPAQKVQDICVVFEKFANKYAQYGYDKVFEDLLNSMMYLGSMGKLHEDDYKQASKLYGELELNSLILAVSDASEGFRDALGEIYMYIASRYKSSALGQFFTPQPIVDLMAAIVNVSDSDTPMKMGDTAGCGSGRNLLALARDIGAGRWKHWFEGVDIDLICVKMTVVNCQLQTIPAFVVHGDALSNVVWASYEIQLARHVTPTVTAWLGIIVKMPTSVCDTIEQAGTAGWKDDLYKQVNSQRVEALTNILEKETEKNAYQDSLQPEPDKDISPNNPKPVEARSKPRKGTPPTNQPALF